MREILFRGKDIHSGKMVEGLYMYYPEGICDGIKDSPAHGIVDAENHLVYQILPETLGQYTGLTNKNGKRYEGDIFQASDGEYIQRYIITWNEESLEWSAECIEDPDGTLPLSEFKVEEIEVIGNIYDSQEMLT